MKTISQKAIFVSALLAGVLTAGVPTTAMTVKATEQTATVKQDIKATPFQVKIPQEKIDSILRRVREYQWYEPIKGSDGKSVGWRYGTDISFMKELADYWVNNYDWRKTEAKINRFQNYRVNIDGQQLHFVLEKGSGKNPQPLLLIHGWPYSFLSYLDVIERLAHPERFGGNASDGFDVVVVSVPGYGFSEAPTTPVGLRAFGKRYHKLMTEILDYKQYIVHGGDQGAISASFMAFDYPKSVKGLHHYLVFPRHPESPYGSGQVGSNPTKAELEFVKDEVERLQEQSAYFNVHLTRPETLSVAMMDSPIGVASWIVEKYYYWTDQRQRPFEKILTLDQLLNEVMLYLVTDTFRTSLWPYAAFQTEIPVLRAGQKIMVPTAITAWPDPLNKMPPREFVERSRGNIIQWTDMPSGGHFPFYEEPKRFVDDIITFGRSLR